MSMSNYGRKALGSLWALNLGQPSPASPQNVKVHLPQQPPQINPRNQGEVERMWPHSLLPFMNLNLNPSHWKNLYKSNKLWLKASKPQVGHLLEESSSMNPTPGNLHPSNMLKEKGKTSLSRNKQLIPYSRSHLLHPSPQPHNTSSRGVLLNLPPLQPH